MGIGNEDQTALAFDGNWREFAPIALTNTLLTFVTLGFYRFWATTRERQYLWGRTRFIDDQLEWTGKGIELFLGFLAATALFGLPLLLLSFLLQGLAMQGREGIAGTIIALLYVWIFYMTGVAIFRGLRYRLSRTYWHGIHGGCDQGGWQYGWSYLWKTVVAYICLMLLFPWSLTALWKERWEAMSFGPHRFVSKPEWSSLMGRYVVAYLSPFVAMIGAMVLAFAVLVPMGLSGGLGAGEEPPKALFAVIGFAVLAFYLIMPILALFFYSAYMRQVVDTMQLSDLAFQFTARTKDWIKFFVGNFALWVLAGLVAAIPIGLLGLFDQFANLQPGQSPFMSHPATFIAFVVALAIPFGLVGPFIRYRNWSFFIRHMEATGEVNLATLTQSETKEIKQGEGLLDAFDMGAM